ncbi:probable DNA-directed RNA polymerase subunit delta [Helianthus annuus]|uniref:probable DNA-directed RNA polymerase subunit delta n=1 Tax=Helianthus annuus TaxID=4232 RepID=UPI001652F6EE|nr:probable DNA-directed RNA polymerase subunit delta [Helianthus annuus]
MMMMSRKRADKDDDQKSRPETEVIGRTESVVTEVTCCDGDGAIFDEDVLIDDVITAEGEIEDDSEEDEDEEKVDDPDDVFSASSHSSDNGDDDDQGGAGITTTEASNEKNVDDYMNDDANERNRWS